MKVARKMASLYRATRFWGKAIARSTARWENGKWPSDPNENRPTSSTVLEKRKILAEEQITRRFATR